MQHNSYADFCNTLRSLTNQEKGDYQELLIKCYFDAHSFLYNIKEYYARVLDELPPIDNINVRDVGVDAYIIHKDNKISLVQIKYRSNPYDSLTRNMIARMVLEAGPIKDRIHNIYLVSNTDNKPVNISEQENDAYNIKYILSNELYRSECWDTIREHAKTIIKSNGKRQIIKLPKLRRWQNEAIRFIGSGNFGRKTIIAPCGAGKTRLMIEIAKNYDRVLILVPSLHLLSQTFTSFCKYKSNRWSYLLVGSDIEQKDNVSFDITIDSDIISKIASVNNICVISTYQSLDKINPSIRFDICICDEAHRCASLKDSNFTLPLSDKFPVDNKLFLTATPKTYKDDIYKDSSMDNIEKFGEMYTYTFKRAIDDNVINDYNIIVGHANIVNESVYDDSSFNALFIRRAVEEYDINSLLVFSNNHKDSKILYNKVKMLNIPGYELILMKLESNSNDKAGVVRRIESGDKIIIFNVRIFGMGSDLPKLESVMLCGGRTSKIDIVQNISRCLRKVNGKRESLVLLPCLLRGEDYNSDGNFDNVRRLLLAIGTVDETIFEEIYGIGGADGNRLKKINYMDLTIDTGTRKEIIELKDVDFELKIFDRISSSNHEEIRIFKWRKRLTECIEFLRVTGHVPRCNSNDIECELVEWLNVQHKSYQPNTGNHRYIMRNKIIRQEWIDALIENPLLSRDNNVIWERKLNELIEYIENNGCIPEKSQLFSDGKNMYKWIFTQRQNYQPITGDHKYIMKDDHIREMWERAILKYPLLNGVDNASIWRHKAQRCINFVIDNNRRPRDRCDDDDESELGAWLSSQHNKYQPKNGVYRGAMARDDIRAEWEHMIVEYPLLDRVDVNAEWERILDQCKQFIETNGYTPRATCSDKTESKLGNWLRRQRSNYLSNKGIIKDKNIRKIWEKALIETPLLYGR
jgi:superfamily II DNA or RNA helicase